MRNSELNTKKFDELLRSDFQQLSATFWSPEEVIKIAVEWMELDASSKVLDIGSGVGKFCIEGARINEAQFTGVEIRPELVDEADRVVQELGLKNVQFICSDIKDIDFSEFSSFFYYNSFCEHLSINEVIDDSLDFSRENHREYEDLVFEQMNKMPKTTKIVCYNSREFILPNTYRLVRMNKEGDLALWIKN